jgi:hypothetical protein
MESEIPASPCSESAGSESSQTCSHHVARRVSFSPKDVKRSATSSPTHSQVLANLSKASILKSHEALCQARQLHEESLIQKGLSALSHDPPLKSAKKSLPQFNRKSPPEASILHLSTNKYQSNPGVPNIFFAGLSVPKAPSAFGSPQSLSPTPKSRFSSRDVFT